MKLALCGAVQISEKPFASLKYRQSTEDWLRLLSTVSVSPASPESFMSSNVCLWLLPLSVDAGLCQSVVHDAKGTHPPRESVLPGAGATLARVSDGHLGKLLLHDGQVYLQAVIDIKKTT